MVEPNSASLLEGSEPVDYLTKRGGWAYARAAAAGPTTGGQVSANCGRFEPSYLQIYPAASKIPKVSCLTLTQLVPATNLNSPW